LDWREWNREKLDAVLAHERSHIERRDPLVQVASAFHRALLWFSPFAWFLHSRIVRTAEEASDDAGVRAIQDRASYAELLLDFVQRGVRVRTTSAAGVPMARYGRADHRIHRILDATSLSCGVTKRAIAAIVLIGVPLAYLAATAKAQNPSAPPTLTKQAPSATLQPRAAAPKPLQAKPASTSGDLFGLGVVTASMASVTSEIEGRIDSLDFTEGQPVKAGQLLATVGKDRILLDAVRAEDAVQRDEVQVEELQTRDKPAPDQLREMRATLSSDREMLRQIQRQMATTEVRAPITGVAGLRLIDAGNLVRPGQAIVTIAQVQPIAVVFTVPQDELPRVRARINAGAAPVVEAWTRDEKTKIATGALTATDNQIDEQTGTIKLKATFDNKDSALFPNQFVNVRLKTR
jgi:RND family efflux transporter MFP subunit